MPCNNIKLIPVKEPSQKGFSKWLTKNTIRQQEGLNNINHITLKCDTRISDRIGYTTKIKDKHEWNKDLLKPKENTYHKTTLYTKPTYEKKRYIATGCGQCNFCRMKRQENWTTRIMLEMEAIGTNNCCFLTLTYKDEPHTQGYNKIEIQKFMKRLRKNEKLTVRKIPNKYLSCGEYGKKQGRIHAHMIIMGWRPNDMKFWKWSNKKKAIYKSKKLHKLWGQGITSLQEVTPKTIKYITLYGTKECKYSHSSDKETNPELYETIKAMNRGDIPKNKETITHWKKLKMAEFNTFSQKIGWEQFLKNEYLINGLDKIGEREIPNFWLQKILYEEHKKPQYEPKGFKTVSYTTLLGDTITENIRDWEEARQGWNAWHQAIKEHEYKIKRRLEAIRILKKRQDDFNEYIKETYGEVHEYSNVKNTISELNAKNTLANRENIIKSRIKQSLDWQ